MAATKRARVDRAMVTKMRVVGDEEGEGDDEKDGVGDKGGVPTNASIIIPFTLVGPPVRPKT